MTLCNFIQKVRKLPSAVPEKNSGQMDKQTNINKHTNKWQVFYRSFIVCVKRKKGDDRLK